MAEYRAERLHLTNQDALVKVNHLMVKRVCRLRYG